MKGKVFVASSLLLSSFYAYDYDNANSYINLKMECYRASKNDKLANIRNSIEGKRTVELLFAEAVLSRTCMDTSYSSGKYLLDEAADITSNINAGLIKIAEGQ